MIDPVYINKRPIGPGHPVYIVAELSANHRQHYEEAEKLIRAAKEAGADAIKLQTYTPDTMTIRSERPEFKISGGTLWDGRTLYDLYGEAYTPWEWQPRLKKAANDLGMDLFSTPFDKTAVDFLEEMDVPAYKIASFEIVDIPLIEYIAGKGKPIIMSTGMASLPEIGTAVKAARAAGAAQIILLKCTSGYPALPEEMNLRSIPDLAKRFKTPVGLSDHTLSSAMPVAAVTLGACLLEKHFTLDRKNAGPDSAFSTEPYELKATVEAIRAVEKALGEVKYGASDSEAKSLVFRRSLYAVKDIKTGEAFTEENVRSIRPSNGLPPRYLKKILKKRAARDIEKGTPLNWELIC